MTWPTAGVISVTDLTSIYELRRRAPLHWYQRAINYREAARVLWVSIEDPPSEYQTPPDLNRKEAFSPIYWALAGTALELALKARIGQRLNECQSADSIPKSHNLIDLWPRAGLAVLPDTEKRYLKVLAVAVVWYGRYPVPLVEQSYDDDRAALWWKRSGSMVGARVEVGWDEFDALFKTVASSFTARLPVS